MEKKELLDRLKTARSWKEFGLTVHDVYKVLSSDLEYTDSTSANEEVLKELTEFREKVSRLTEANKQLRAEAKHLRARK